MNSQIAEDVIAGPAVLPLNKASQKKVYIETYGCQMNVYDSELVARIMNDLAYEITDDPEEADAIFLNTCSIRENAEQRIWGRLTHFKKMKERNADLVIGVLGCMAKNLEAEIHAKRPYVNVVLGPDSYKKLPQLLQSRQKPIAPIPSESIGIRKQPAVDLEEYRDFKINGLQIDTRLSRTEVYENLAPLRFKGVSAWIAIMRGCDNFCTFCIVPFTRGRERSRTVQSVVDEVRVAADQGYSEINLLGQNVNSYRDGNQDFAHLLDRVSQVEGIRRIRFTSPHPKDFPIHLLNLIAERDNLCNQLHMPVQSGSNKILDLMNRTYTREEFFELIEKARKIIPDVALTTDIIAGFPGESEHDHEQTLDLMRKVEFNSAYTFKYSPRPSTKAFEMNDDVPEAAKSRRLQEIIDLQKRIGLIKLRQEVGRQVSILIEEVSSKSDSDYRGRTEKGQIVIVPRGEFEIGSYVQVQITDAGGHTLFGAYV